MSGPPQFEGFARGGESNSGLNVRVTGKFGGLKSTLCRHVSLASKLDVVQGEIREIEVRILAAEEVNDVFLGGRRSGDLSCRTVVRWLVPTTNLVPNVPSFLGARAGAVVMEFPVRGSGTGPLIAVLQMHDQLM